MTHEYTGKTIRLPDLPEQRYTVRPLPKEIKPRYLAEEYGENWAVIDTSRMPLEPPDSRADASNEQTGIPIPDESQNGAQNVTRSAVHVKLHKQPYTAHNPITDALMPVLTCCIALLALVVLGDYRTLGDIPMYILIAVLGIALYSYVSYRYSTWYERGGRALERLMRATHNQDGTLNREHVKQLLNGELVVTEEDV